MTTFTAFTVAFASFCYQMAEKSPPAQCQFSCQCTNESCDEFLLRMDHMTGQSITIKRPGEFRVAVQMDGINQERIYHLSDPGEDFRVRKELTGNQIKSARYRTTKTELYCGNERE